MSDPAPSAAADPPTITTWIPEGVRQALHTLAPYIRAPGLRSWLSYQSDDLVALSDIGPDDTPYETYATYLLRTAHLPTIVGRLLQLRRDHGLRNWTMKHKRRDRRGHAALLPAWLSCIGTKPGIVIVIAWDRRIRRMPDYQRGIDHLRAE